MWKAPAAARKIESLRKILEDSPLSFPLSFALSGPMESIAPAVPRRTRLVRPASPYGISPRLTASATACVTFSASSLARALSR